MVTNSDSFIKELNDIKVIDEGVSAIDRAVINEVIPHFIYCGNHYSTTKEAQYELQKMFLEKMRKHGVQSAMLTLMSLSRSHLVTKEKVKKAYKENFIYPRPINKLGKIVKFEQSIHEDLETLFQNLQNQVNVKKVNVPIGCGHSYFFPMLTEKEKKLVESKNEEHLKTYSKYSYGGNPDVDPKEMASSDSKSKFVHGHGWRMTYPLNLESSCFNQPHVTCEPMMKNINN